VGLSLTAEHRRGHGALYDAVNAGRVDLDRLRRLVVGLPLPRDASGRIVLAVDVSNWLRPDAATAPGRSFCHVHGRGKGGAQMIPGRPYSFVAALEPGRTSWTHVLDVQRITPTDDVTEVTARQIRQVVDRIRAAGQWVEGDPPILVMLDAGYDPVRPAWLLWEVPVLVTARVRADRVFHLPAPERTNARPDRSAGPCGTARSSIWTARTATRPPTYPQRPRPAGTAPRSPTPGTTPTSSCNAAAAGPPTTEHYRSCKAP